MKICVRLAPAYPPELGEPEIAAPLATRITAEPARSGRNSAALQKLKLILTSDSQLAANSSQLNSCSGAAGGNTPPLRIRTSGSQRPNTMAAADSSVASSARVSVP